MTLAFVEQAVLEIDKVPVSKILQTLAEIRQRVFAGLQCNSFQLAFCILEKELPFHRIH